MLEGDLVFVKEMESLETADQKGRGRRDELQRLSDASKAVWKDGYSRVVSDSEPEVQKGSAR